MSTRAGLLRTKGSTMRTMKRLAGLAAAAALLAACGSPSAVDDHLSDYWDSLSDSARQQVCQGIAIKGEAAVADAIGEHGTEAVAFFHERCAAEAVALPADLLGIPA